MESNVSWRREGHPQYVMGPSGVPELCRAAQSLQAGVQRFQTSGGLTACANVTGISEPSPVTSTASDPHWSGALRSQVIIGVPNCFQHLPA